MRGFLGVSLLAVCFVVAGSLGGCGGCGDDGKGGQLPDAPPLIDAPPDMMIQAVTLTVTNLGAPNPGVHVYFINPDGTVAKTTDTDANGNASAVVGAGGSVTALKPFEAPPAGKFAPDEIRTFAGVKPGDHLVLSRAVSESVSFNLVAAAAPGAESPFRVQYAVYSTCAGQQQNNITPGGSGGGSGDPAPGGQVTLQDCGGTADVAVVASEDVTPRLTGKVAAEINWLGSVYHGNATLADSTTLDLSGDTYDTSPAVTFTYDNMPANTNSILVSHSPILPHGRLGPFQGDATSGSVTINEAKTPATKAIVDTQVNVFAQHEVIDWGDISSTYTLDLGATLLKEPTFPSFDPATGKLTWDEAAQGATPDATLVGITVRRVEPNLSKWHWEIVAPYAAGSITYPKLPTDVFDWTPLDSDEISRDPVTSVKVPGGYDALRARAFDVNDRLGFSAAVAGASGRAVVVTSGLPLL
jgi:hypothetical protein